MSERAAADHASSDGALTASPAWQALSRHRDALGEISLKALFSEDAGRAQRMSLKLGPITADYSKHLVTEETLRLLTDLARQADLEGWRDRMFDGAPINGTEGRAVLHTALRRSEPGPVLVDGQDVMPGIRAVSEQMEAFVAAVEAEELRGWTNQTFSDVVNLGIGGSDLGPKLVCQALAPYGRRDLRMHFVSNVDGNQLAETLRNLEPQRTLFVIASKSFTTQETLANARTARAWFLDHAGSERAIAKHFIALSTNIPAAREFGIAPQNVFGFWDWVGGRYSLWSAIGLPIVLSIGWTNWQHLLAGAALMDRHFRTAPLEQNLPVILALLGIWYRNFLGWPAQAVIPYDHYLSRLPAYLQQLDMESNGKRVDRDGNAVDYDTGPIIFGEPGTDAQHSFFQLLHQGTTRIPVDVIAAIEPQHKWRNHHQMLLANAVAQTAAWAFGRDAGQAKAELLAGGLDAAEAVRLAPHKVFPGNRPSTTLLLHRLDPFSLGMLLALYEHKVFAQGILWRINSFDQMGVELGKQLAKGVLRDLAAGAPSGDRDPSSAALIAKILGGEDA